MATLHVPAVHEPAPTRGRTPVHDPDARRAAAAARSRSRFQEGSMNDRVSAVPPPHFLGPDDELSPSFASPSSPYTTPLSPTVTTTTTATTTVSGSTYATSVFRRGVSRSRSDESCDRHRRPISAAGETLSDRSMRSGLSGASSRTFFSKPWLENIKGMLAGKTPSQHFQQPQPFPPSPQPSPQPEYKPQFQSQQYLRPPPAYKHDDRPSREDIMKGYKELMASDFFASRAITSTRQPPPGSRFPPPAPSSGAASSATSICSASPRPQQQAFPADLLTTLNGASAPPPSPRPRLRPPKERPSRPVSAIITRWPLSPRGSMDVGPRAAAPGRHSIDGYAPQRGMKRPRFAIRGGQVVEIDDDEEDNDAETDVGRAIKRLRKSASRLSVDLSIPRLRRSTSDSPSTTTPTDNKPRKHHRLAKLVIGARFSSSKNNTPVRENPSSSTPTYPLAAAPSPFVARGPASSSSLAPPHHGRPSRWATPRASMDPLSAVPDTNRGIPTVPEVPEHLYRGGKTRMSMEATARPSFSMTPSVRSRTDENMCYVGTNINMEDVMMLG